MLFPPGMQEPGACPEGSDDSWAAFAAAVHDDAVKRRDTRTDDTEPGPDSGS